MLRRTVQAGLWLAALSSGALAAQTTRATANMYRFILDLELLRTLAESGAFKPVIDGTYPFARIADAHGRVGTGRKRGTVVIALD